MRNRPPTDAQNINPGDFILNERNRWIRVTATRTAMDMTQLWTGPTAPIVMAPDTKVMVRTAAEGPGASPLYGIASEICFWASCVLVAVVAFIVDDGRLGGPLLGLAVILFITGSFTRAKAERGRSA